MFGIQTIVAAMPHHVACENMVALIEGERLAMNDDRNQDHLQDDQSACKGPDGHFQSIHRPSASKDLRSVMQELMKTQCAIIPAAIRARKMVRSASASPLLPKIKSRPSKYASSLKDASPLGSGTLRCIGRSGIAASAFARGGCSGLMPKSTFFQDI